MATETPQKKRNKYSLIICQTEKSEELNFKVQNELTEKKIQTLPRNICSESSGAMSAVCINTAERVCVYIYSRESS